MSDYDASELLDDPVALRERAQHDGFLFFRGFLPRQELLALRRVVLELLQSEGLVATDAPLMEGLADVEQTRDRISWGVSCVTPEIYRAVQRLPAFHSLARHPKLMALYTTLFDEEVLAHPRNILRMMIPARNAAPTAPHQDAVYINGTENTWTCWAPIGDCPPELGNLAVVRGSHTRGLQPVHSGAGAGGLGVAVDDADDWVHFDFEAGDILTFPSLTIHKSLPTQCPDHIRLSLDYRYQPVSEPVHPSSLEPHMGIASWDDLYRDWPANSGQYYWHSQTLTRSNARFLEKYPELRARDS